MEFFFSMKQKKKKKDSTTLQSTHTHCVTIRYLFHTLLDNNNNENGLGIKLNSKQTCCRLFNQTRRKRRNTSRNFYYINKNSLFIVLSLVAALLLPRSVPQVSEVLPTHRDSANTRPFSRTYFTCFAGYHHLLIIPFIRVLIINFNHGK